jgi:hypothetical protein
MNLLVLLVSYLSYPASTSSNLLCVSSKDLDRLHPIRSRLVASNHYDMKNELTIVTPAPEERFRSCKNKVSKVLGARVSFKNEIKADEAASVWIFLRFKWYCNEAPATCFAAE